MTTPMLSVRGLTKSFDRFRAVDDLSFDLAPGRIYAFIGPNGAGKTTTMRMICTLEEPTAGEIHVAGLSTKEHPYAIRRMVGYMPDHYGTYPHLTIRDYLEFYARAYEVDPGGRSRRVDSIMDFTGLTKIDGKLVETLSKGQRQRLNLGRALLNDPKLLILDEPAAGLDPRARIELRYLMLQLAERGKTLFVSSHILTELAEISSEMLIIDKGKMVTFGSVEQIHRTMGLGADSAVEVNVRLEAPSETLAKESVRLEQFLLERAGVAEVRPSGETPGSFVFSFLDGREQAPRLLREMVLAEFPVVEFRPTALSMEDVFMQITGSSEMDE